MRLKTIDRCRNVSQYEPPLPVARSIHEFNSDHIYETLNRERAARKARIANASRQNNPPPPPPPHQSSVQNSTPSSAEQSPIVDTHQTNIDSVTE